MVFNATFYSISVISWQSVLLDFYNSSSLKQQSADTHVAPHYSDSEPTSLCSYSLMLRT